MCGLKEYGNIDEKSSESVRIGGGRPLLKELTTDSLKSLCSRFNFIYAWLKLLESNYASSCYGYQENMKQLFHKITTKNPEVTPE